MLEFDFAIDLIDGCVKDFLSNPSTISDFDYFLGQTGAIEIQTPTYDQLLSNCQLSWWIFALSPQENLLDAKQQSYVQLQADGSIKIDAGNDQSIEGQDWKFRLKLTSIKSLENPRNELNFDFTMNIKDRCINDILEATSSISDFSYYIAYTELYSIPAPTYT